MSISPSPVARNYIENRRKEKLDALRQTQEERFKKRVQRADYGVVGAMTVGGLAAGNLAYLNSKDNFSYSIKEAEKGLSAKVLSVIEMLQARFNIPIKLIQGGGRAEVPNCIMFEGPDHEAHQKLFRWVSEDVKLPFIEINKDAEILDQLELSEKSYQSTGKRTLYHISGFDKLLTPGSNFSSPATIASLKDIMSSTSEGYHSTIFFSTSDPSKLDRTAIQPHRVERIKADLTLDELNKYFSSNKSIEELKEGLSNLSRKKPIIKGTLIGAGLGVLLVGILRLSRTKGKPKSSNQS